MKTPIQQNKYIFLADDDEDDRFFFAGALQEINPAFTCQLANGGPEAIKMLTETEFLPDLIFLDINMPVLNGLECLKKIRSQKRYDKIPIIILTTASPESQRTKSHGADLYITKPSSFNELRDLIRSALDKFLHTFE